MSGRGTKWFNWTMNRMGANPQESYQMLVKRHFRGTSESAVQRLSAEVRPV